MLKDLRDTLRYWRVVHLLGLSTLRSRYARSRFGQAWITVSNMIFVFVVGFIWTKIWKLPAGEYLPYVGIGYVLFLFLSHAITESCHVLVLDARVYANESRPFMLSAFALVYKNLLIFLHNVPLIIVFVVWSGVDRIRIGMFYPVFWILALLFLVALGYSLSLLCARFRDMTQIVNLVMQTAFLLTPVVWQIEFVPPEFRDLITMINPLAAFIEVLRNPLLGVAPSGIAMASCASWAVAVSLLAVIVHGWLRREIIFWI